MFQGPFDGRPCQGCTLNELVLDLFLVSYLPAAVARDVIDENERNTSEQMASLRFYDLTADCPTNAAALLFAKNPLHWIPGAWVQFVRWAGTTMADEPISDKRFSGDLLTLLREIEAFLSVPSGQCGNGPSGGCWNRHCGNDDRIENPGGLYGIPPKTSRCRRIIEIRS